LPLVKAKLLLVSEEAVLRDVVEEARETAEAGRSFLAADAARLARSDGTGTVSKGEPRRHWRTSSLSASLWPVIPHQALVA
jgi:hypothetical protein